jgi:predicted esterase
MRRSHGVLLLLACGVLLLVAWRGPLVAHARVLLLLSQELPQSPAKPLAWLTPEPIHERLRLETPRGPVVGDLIRPARRLDWLPEPRRPALVLAFGLAMYEQDRPALLGLARTLARLGFVVLWPRHEALDQGAPLLEDPATFATAVRHLSTLDVVDRERISLFGFSVGASVALVAASDPAVADDVRTVIAFGGYYDVFAYLLSAATHGVELDGKVEEWQPTEEVRKRLLPVLEARAAPGLLRVLEEGASGGRAAAAALLRAAPPDELAALRGLSPADRLGGLRARVFILHDRGDVFVPYVESEKLRRALPPEQVGGFLLTDLFAHAQPKSGFSWDVARDIARLYGFVYGAIRSL